MTETILQPTRVFDLMDRSAERYRRRPVFRYGKIEVDAPSYIESTRTLSVRLLEMGVGRGEAVALVSANRPEWNMAEMAVLQVGAVLLPLCVGLTAEEYVDAMQRASVRVLIAEDASMLERFRLILPQVESLQHTLLLNPTDGRENPFRKKRITAEETRQLESRRGLSTTDDICCLHYTGDGTFRKLTHRTLLEQAESQCATESLRRRAAMGNNALCTTYGRVRNYACQWSGRTINYPIPV